MCLVVVVGRRSPLSSDLGRPSQHRHERRLTALRSASNQPMKSHLSDQNQPLRLPCGGYGVSHAEPSAWEA